MMIDLIIISRNANYWLSLLDDHAIQLIFEYHQPPKRDYLNEYNKSDDYDAGLIETDEEYDKIICGRYTRVYLDYYENGVFYCYFEQYIIESDDWCRTYFARKAEDVGGLIDLDDTIINEKYLKKCQK